MNAASQGKGYELVLMQFTIFIIFTIEIRAYIVNN